MGGIKAHLIPLERAMVIGELLLLTAAAAVDATVSSREPF